MQTGSILRQAFLDPINLFVLIMAMIFSQIMRNPLPLILGILWEIGFLSIAPQTSWLRQRARNREIASETNRRMETQSGLRMKLSSEDARRYERVRNLCREIRALAGKSQEDPLGMIPAEFGALDSLEHSFLELLAARLPYRERINQYQAGKLEQEIAEVGKRLQSEQEPEVLRILEKNRALLEKRRAISGRITTNLRALDAQVDAIENAFQLLADTVVSVQGSPEALAAEIESLVMEAEITERILRETTPKLEEIHRLAPRQIRGNS